jgi:hypothetical protein
MSIRILVAGDHLHVRLYTACGFLHGLDEGRLF